MVKKLPVLIACCVIAGGVGASFADDDDGATAKRVRGTASGWVHYSAAADLNDDGFSGVLGQSRGKSNLGQFDSSNSGDVLPWDGLSFCDSGNGILLTYGSSSSVIRLKSGDLIYGRLSETIPSTLCFNIVDNVSYSFELHEDVLGGTGRYEGATGTMVSIGAGRNITAVHATASGTIEGELFLVGGDDDD